MSRIKNTTLDFTSLYPSTMIEDNPNQFETEINSLITRAEQVDRELACNTNNASKINVEQITKIEDFQRYFLLQKTILAQRYERDMLVETLKFHLIRYREYVLKEPQKLRQVGETVVISPNSEIAPGSSSVNTSHEEDDSGDVTEFENETFMIVENNTKPAGGTMIKKPSMFQSEKLPSDCIITYQKNEFLTESVIKKKSKWIDRRTKTEYLTLRNWLKVVTNSKNPSGAQYNHLTIADPNGKEFTWKNRFDILKVVNIKM